MKYKYIILIIIIAISCKKNTDNLKGLVLQNYKKKDFKQLIVNTDSVKAIEMPPIGLYEKPFFMSSLLDTCYTVSLESTNDNLIGKIDGVKIVDNTIFILDSYKSKSVFMFDLNGKYIRKIGVVGNGPGEYPFPEDFEIDDKNKEVLVFNGTIRKIFRYNFEGKFLGDISIGLGCYGISLLKNGNIVLLGGDYGNEHLAELKNKILYVINKKGEIVSYGPNVSEDFKNVKMSTENPLAENSTISYSYKFSDTIYTINEKEIKATYTLDFGKDVLNIEKLSKLDTRAFFKDIEEDNKKPNFRGNHFQTNNYLYFHFFYGKKTINCFYNKKTSKLFASELIDFSNVNCLYTFNPIGTHQDYFISTLDAFNIVESKENILKIKDKNSKFLKDTKQTNKILSELKIKETDNPVLIFFKLKDTP